MIYPEVSASTNKFGLLMTSAPLIFQVISDNNFIQTYCLFMGPLLFILACSKLQGSLVPCSVAILFFSTLSCTAPMALV